MLGIFDSGLGGLTVVHAVERVLPDVSYVYLGDTARLPYGTKTRETISKYTIDALKFLKSQGATIPVVACHTASSVIVSDSALQQRIADDFGADVFNVVTPAIEAARNATQNGHIGVLATSATVRSGVYETSLHDRVVTQVSASVLVGLAEEGFTTSRHIGAILEEILNPFLRADVDTIVLACTHFAILGDVIRAIVGSEIRLIDPGVELAKQLYALRDSLPEGKKRFFATDVPDDFGERATRFLGRTIDVEPV